MTGMAGHQQWLEQPYAQRDADDERYDAWVREHTAGRLGGVRHEAAQAIALGVLADLSDKLNDPDGLLERLTWALQGRMDALDSADLAELGAALGLWPGPDGEGR